MEDFVFHAKGKRALNLLNSEQVDDALLEKLDDLLIEFSDDPVFIAKLKMQRLTKLGK